MDLVSRSRYHAVNHGKPQSLLSRLSIDIQQFMSQIKIRYNITFKSSPFIYSLTTYQAYSLNLRWCWLPAICSPLNCHEHAAQQDHVVVAESLRLFGAITFSQPNEVGMFLQFLQLAANFLRFSRLKPSSDPDIYYLTGSGQSKSDENFSTQTTVLGIPFCATFFITLTKASRSVLRV